MSTIVVTRDMDKEQVVSILCEASERLHTAEGEIVVDFSAVRRIDTRGIRDLEAFAGLAKERRVSVVLHGVNLDVYKALTLVNLTRGFDLVINDHNR